MYISPHTHTDYSNYGMKDSVNRIENIIKRLKELKQPAWAICDHNTCSGIVDAYKKSNKAGIKLIPGAELYLTYDLTIQQQDLSHICFWAKDRVGLTNLFRLTTEAHGNKGLNPNNYYYKSRVDIDLIRKYSEGLMCGSACLGGWLNTPNWQENLEKLIEIFPSDLWLELHTYQCEEQFTYNQKLIEIAKQYKLPLIAATDAHFTLKSDVDLRNYFKNTSKEQDDKENSDGTLYLQSEDEVREYLNYLPKAIIEEAIANTEIFASKSNVEIKFGEKHYPEYPCEDREEEVRKICRQGWKEKNINSYPNKQEHADRFNKVEMPVLIKQDYLSYFLITWDYINKARKKGIPVGPGRGSVVGSEVAWLMGLTALDPIKYNLTFERFAHNERLAPPDIDVDISRKRRHEVIQQLEEDYGEVYQCRTFGTLGALGSIRIAGKALDYTQEEINNIANQISKYETEDDDEELSSYEQKIWMLDHIRNEENAKLIDLAKRFVGVISGYGKHASAVIILNKDITEFCSIERQVDSKTHEVNYIAACAFPLLEEQGLMKADVLGLKTLDVIYDTVELVKEDIDNIPLDDEQTATMLCNSRTAGCFQIEGQGMTQLVRNIQPKEFIDLIPLVALFRPGPLGAIVEETNNTMVQTYVKVRNEEIEPVYLHEKLKPILQETYSTILYQEQILEIVKELCGYSLGEADILRRIIGKKKVDEMKPAIDTMIERGVANGIPKDAMRQIADRITTFAMYGFNKSHSAAYGLLAYQTAYLKAHYPLQFMWALINNENNVQEKTLPYIDECKKIGIEVLPPDLRRKNIDWIIEDDCLAIGLHYIKGIGKNLNYSKIDTLEDIILNNPKDVVEALIKSGAVDYLKESRQSMLAKVSPLQDMLKRQVQCKEKIVENELSLKQVECILEIGDSENYDLTKLEKEKKKFGRQLEQWKKKLEECKLKEINIDKFDEVEGEVSVLGFSFKAIPKVKKGKLVKLFTKNDKKGNLMAWLTLNSNYGEFVGLIFASQWKHLKNKIKQGNEYWFVIENKVITDIKEAV